MSCAVVGTFLDCGAAGIMFVASIGERIYDAINLATPFVLVGMANGLLDVGPIWLLPRKPISS